MYLPLGESSGKTNVRRAGARALVGFLCLAFVVGIFALPHGVRAAVSCGFGSAIAGGRCQGFITDTAQTTWTVPSDWTASNTIEAIGGSGQGADGAGSNHGGGGSGGGAYANVSNLNLASGALITIQVGMGPPQFPLTLSGSSTFFNASTCSGASVCAAGGSPGVGQTGGAGGSVASSVGTVIFAGGKGGNGGGPSTNGGGGGGAGGPNGAGNNGADQPASTGGSGDAGSGGGGGAIDSSGGNGTEWDSSHGSGGGAGGSSGAVGSDIGGNYGGGVGGRHGGSGVGVQGHQGIIVITYTPLPNLLQEDYIFENDSASSVGANTSPVSAGAARANMEKGERFVVRFLLTNTGGVSSTAFVVQMSHGSSGTDWQTVTSGGEIAYSYGISGTSVSQITSRKTAAACSGSSAFNNDGRWYENRPDSNSYTFGASNCTELAWIFSTASSVPGTTYRLRLFNQTANKVLDGSTATPTLTIVNPQTRDYSKTGTADGEIFAAPTNSNDLTYYLDATGYSAVASDDSVYDTATAFQANSIPISLFKIKNPNGNSTDQATITWNGQSNVSSQVDLEIWNGSSWVNVQSNASPSVNTDFTLTGAKTGSAYYDSNFFIYVRVKQAAGVEALRTDQISGSFAAPVTGAAILSQRGFIFENDAGNTVDTNTQRGTGIAYPVEKGERFIVRFQVDNTGSGATTAQFTVQYDHNDGVWKSVTAGEISTQLGISGANGDALTTNKAGSCQGGTSFVNGAWQEGTATTGSFTLTNGNCTEFGFIFSTATAIPRTTYNFRLVNGTNGNQVFQNSVATPSIVLITMREKTYSKTGLGAELAAAPTNANDLAYYLDSTGYAAIIKKDGVYDTASSSGAGNVPIQLFKIRNYNENTTDSFTVTWIGHSNVAPSSNSVFLDLWDNTHSTWITASTDTFTAAGTDFTFSSATSGSLFYDANYFVYVRVRQAAGVEALSTDQVSIGFGNTLPGPQVDRSVTLSDSRPGVGANQTILFGITMSIEASERLELTWPLAFAFPPDLDCGDVDVATGTQFMLSTTSTACAATATTWGVEFMSDTRVFRLTAPSTAGTYVATGTQITITIGLNASSQQTGTTQIVNPASTGTYTVSVGGNFAGTGNMLVSINAGVTVSATVAENLALTVSSVAADGATVSAIATAPTSVPFGTVSLNTFYIGCQDLVVSTNAGNGYALTTQESSAMRTANGLYTIPDTTCDGGTCSESVAGAWTNAAKNGLGHTCANQVNHDCSSAYSGGTNFLQFANIAGGEIAQPVMSSSTNATATGRIKFRLSAGLAQPAGAYTTLITYIITGTY